MGMYTEIFFRAALKPDPELEQLLVSMFHIGEIPSDHPKHPFFECHRATTLFRGDSAYFPTLGTSQLFNRGYGSRKTLFISTSLKAYDQEGDKFFDWIDPHVAEVEGTFLGYTMYEEADQPTLRFKQSDS